MTRVTSASADAPILQACEGAQRAVPPAWPLASSVAVNPFLGQTATGLAATGALLERVAGIAVTMPRAWYAERIASGEITHEDLQEALAIAPQAQRPANLEALLEALQEAPAEVAALPTVADLAAEASGIDWPSIIADRIGAFAAGHFDEGQALWASPLHDDTFAAWRAFATRDLTPEILGLGGFAQTVADTPEHAEAALCRAASQLGLDADAAPTAFHRLLITLGGWAQFARYRLWQAELAEGTDATLRDLLVVRLVWDAALLAQYGERIAERWRAVCAIHATPVEASDDHVVDGILQEAAERAAQRMLAQSFAAATPADEAEAARRPALQMAFCIDVRSEVIRRALEAVDPGIRTLGFAGFFGLGVAHRRFASDVRELRLPVLLNPGLESCSGGVADAQQDLTLRLRARATRAWGRFKLAAVSSFAFVEATGPLYVAKLFMDALGLRSKAEVMDPAPRIEPALDPEARIGAAESVLRAMSLTEGFAPLVLIAGHGARVVNNPHASALHCGACGGYTGEVNARLLAGLLNDREVRTGLVARGIEIPRDTLFLGALHDTTSDAVTIYEDGHTGPAHATELEQARAWLAVAAGLARAERALRLPHATDGDSLMGRGRDWSEVRPEWALAGCKAFIAAPRARTLGSPLEGRAFLHDYDWRRDEGFGVLELILTAPVVVASWISLQYYGSTVAPEVFGSGNKLLHNVSGGIGVVEGNGGMLRAGLPWQSVHDGAALVHEPLRLSVCIEAPRDAVIDILSRHEGVRALFDNRWLHLFILDDEGRMAWRYGGDLQWTEMVEGAAAAPAAAAGEGGLALAS